MSGTLLRDLLGYLSSGRAHTMNELASALGVHEALLEQMLADLERAGYMHMQQAACECSREACASCSGCALRHQGRIWAITEKGLRAART